MRIDPNVEKPARALLGHAIRAEWDDYADVAEEIGEERFVECLSLYLRVAGYIAIDACGHNWPSDTELTEIARRIAAADLNLDLTDSAVYGYLAHSALNFEPLAHVFSDPEQASRVPVFATAALLVTYRREGTDWWEYLEQIELGLEEAAHLSENAVPAALLLSRRKHAISNRAAEQRLPVRTLAMTPPAAADSVAGARSGLPLAGDRAPDPAGQSVPPPSDQPGGTPRCPARSR